VLDHQLAQDSITRHHLGKGQRAVYIEVPDVNHPFKPGHQWASRCTEAQLGTVTYTFPAIIDVLIGKLHRVDEADFMGKDWASFHKIRPREDALLRELLQLPNDFAPRRVPKPLQKSIFHRNVELLWRRLYERRIDVRSELLQPMLESVSADPSAETTLIHLREAIELCTPP
jgi:hypothetical protein